MQTKLTYPTKREACFSFFFNSQFHKKKSEKILKKKNEKSAKAYY